MNSEFDIRDYIAVLRRRWLILATPALLCAVIASLVASALPERYRARARILVESQTIPEELARSTVTSGPAERLRVIEQRLTTRSNLLDIAARFDVFEGRALSSTEIVDEMRSATTFENVPLATIGRGQVTASAIDIAFEAASADVAARVANEFVTLLLEENLRARNESAAETLDFFAGEVRRLATELAASEERIKSYKSANESALPENLDFLRSERAAIEVRSIERARRRETLEAERRLLEEAMRSGAPTDDAQLSPQEAELANLRRSLLQSRTLYSESHPTVRSLTARIAALEEALGAGSGENEGAASRFGREAQNKLDALDRSLELLDRQAETDAARLAEIDRTIARAPQVEIGLAALQRELTTLQLQHQDAVLKRAQAETGERLEVSRAAERFEVIEQAETPNAPDSPNPPLIIAAGFAGGVGLGAALTILLELLNQRIRSPRDLEARFGLRPIVSIPYILTQRQIFMRKLGARATVFAALILAPAAIYAVDQYYKPLPVMIDDMSRAIGLGAVTGLISR